MARECQASTCWCHWPAGLGAKGNRGVAETVAKTKHSIGYVEYVQAVQSKLTYATLQNQAGTFVEPSAASFQAAASKVPTGAAAATSTLCCDSARQQAYPIVATVFVLMSKIASPNKTRSVLNLLRWSLERGAKEAAQLGYVPLPPTLVAQIKGYWARNLSPGN